MKYNLQRHFSLDSFYSLSSALLLHIIRLSNDDATAMSSINFAAAQERVLARQRERQSHLRALEVERQAARGSSTLTRLPYPANRVSQIGFSFWDVIKGREGTRPEYRVGQVDAELLDEELLDLFKGQVGEALKYFNVGHLCFSLDKIVAKKSATSKRRLVTRNPPRATGGALQIIDLGSQRFIRRGAAEFTVHGWTELIGDQATTDNVAEDSLRSADGWWSICLGQVGRLAYWTGGRVR